MSKKRTMKVLLSKEIHDYHDTDVHIVGAVDTWLLENLDYDTEAQVFDDMAKTWGMDDGQMLAFAVVELDDDDLRALFDVPTIKGNVQHEESS
jgi:hypothetical protein